MKKTNKKYSINLIGISGHIGSGKDTTGKILQLLYEGSPNREIIEFIKEDLTIWKPVWEIKKFADKLKDVVCLLIGCNREQLEDREFKEKELGEEWWYWEGICGTSGFKLLTQQEYDTLSISQKSWYELVKLTPRKLLQLIGTECGRQIIHPNIWVNALFADYICSCGHTLNPNPISHVEFVDCVLPKWIITDVRFPNEAQAIKDRGGIVIGVNRPRKGLRQEGIYVPHPSETSLDNYDFDYVINNNGNIEELVEKVKQLNLM